MTRTLVVSDIHGCIEEFNALLKLMGYHPPHDQLVLLGDYVDRGPDSRAVVERVMELSREWGAVVLGGNHDKMAYDALMNEDDKLDTHWMTNGGFHTLMSYCAPELAGPVFGWKEYMDVKAKMKQEYGHHLEFLGSLPLYHETEAYIFVHAGIDPSLDDWRNTAPYDFIWIREKFFQVPLPDAGKSVVFGHTSTESLHGTAEIWFSPEGDKIGIDGGCAYGHQLNGLEISAEGLRSYCVRKGEG
ncbi:metallophosphoesterase family protein [Paenibacillus donghaensis]|uniref:Calcineurin-like phosphoesterase domain-containing protein n=1 Tax=Paenibacillus donghaensis TaxID=414771 RepID=A0A2Z2KB97_9BACL|nr:metallophosphoesterase family protein [Paenibacillus donghaensis]ASA22807.1 hypothetical protein B9T62_19580 [Paenibacillus donghaensis]